MKMNWNSLFILANSISCSSTCALFTSSRYTSNSSRALGRELCVMKIA